MLTLLDTNACLRTLLDDIPEQASAAHRAIEDGAFTYPEVIAECVNVLGGRFYNVPRAKVAEAVSTLLDDVSCERGDIIRLALSFYAGTQLDFVDCMLAATHALQGCPVLTFDKKLARFMD